MSEEVQGTPLERLRREIGELRNKLLEIDRIVRDLELPAFTGDRAEPVLTPMDLQGASQAVRSLSQEGDQPGILARLLEETARFSDRAVLFLEQEDDGYRAWRAQGFSSAGWEATEIGHDESLLELLRGQQTLEFDLATGEAPRWMLALEGQGRAALFPLSFGTHTPLLLYVDGSPAPQFDSLEMLVEMARLVLQNQYLGQLVQIQDQGGPPPKRWPALESLAPERPSRQREAMIEEPPASAETDMAVVGAEDADQDGAELAEGFEPSSEGQPLAEVPAPQGTQRPEGHEVPAVEQPVVTPSGSPPEEQRPWEIESRADLRPEDLGLSQVEFDRLMGQASTDWLQIQKAREEAVAGIASEESKEDEAILEPDRSPLPDAVREGGASEGDESQAAKPDDGTVPAPERPEETASIGPGPGEPATATASEPVKPVETLVPPSPPAAESVAESDGKKPLGEESAANGEPAVSAEAAEIPIEEIPSGGKSPSGEAEAEVVQEPDEATATAEVLHEEARRFARLLVAEIKLYNESEVENGRQNGDLYSRLKSDIDRSREMYEKRVHPSVKGSVDYFHAQLVQVLAQDDEALLGQEYPGARVVENA